MEEFFFGAHGSKPGDYYYVRNKNGAKIYYSKITNQRIAKDRIKKSIIDQIQEKDPGFDVASLVNLKNIYLKEITVLQRKVAEIDQKLNGYDEQKIKDFQKQKEKEEEEIKKRKVEYEKERKETLRKLFQQFDQTKGDTFRTPKKEKATSFGEKSPTPNLEKFGIQTKKDWKDWLLKNHPDKGGDSTLCQEVIAEGRSKGW